MLIYRARNDAEKRYAEKTTQKMDFTGVEILCVDINQMNAPYFIYEIDQRKKLNTFGEFENQTPTQNFAKFLKSNSQGIEPKSLYLQNRHKSLN